MKATDPPECLDQTVMRHRIAFVYTDVLAAHHPHSPLVAVDELAERVAVSILGSQHERVVIRRRFKTR